MKAYKLKSGSWRCQARYKDRYGEIHRPSFTAPTRKEAEYLAMQFLMSEREKNDHIKVGHAIDKYIEHRSAILSPSTIRGYRTIQRNNIDAIADMRVEDVTSEDIQRFINLLSQSLSAKTVRNVFGLVKSAILAVEPFKPINVRLPQKEVANRRIPTDAEVKRLLEESKSDEYLYKAILLASIGTLRRGEVCALTYEDIIGNVIHVHSDMVADENHQYAIKPMPKTSTSDRYIELSDDIIKELGTGTGRIVPITPNALGARYRVLCAKLDMNFRFHDLRHYAASIMHAIGIPDQYIMQRGGWKTDDILKSVYRNVLEDKKNEFSQKTNSYMDNLLPKDDE